MNRVLLIIGISFAIIGLIMQILLRQLYLETFRADLGPWITGAIAVIAIGIVISASALLLPRERFNIIRAHDAARYFALASMINAFSAAAFALPVLIPSFEFPILITTWPGIYMVIAYAFFIIVGVLGNIAWMSLLANIEKFFSKNLLYKEPLIFHLILTQLAIYSMSSFMFLGGYVGSMLDHQGIGSTVVGTAMEFAVIPSALSIFAIIIAQVIGLANILVSVRSGIKGLGNH